MRSLLRFTLFLALAVSSTMMNACAQQPGKQLTSSQLLALVAIQSLPETIAQDIQHRGFAFKPAAGYRELLVDAGANPKVLAAFRFGPDNSLLAQPLTSQANALRSIGRTDEAARIEQRIKPLQASSSN